MSIRNRNINTSAVVAMVVVIALIMLRYAADISVIGSIWSVSFISTLAVTALLLLVSLSRRMRVLLARTEKRQTLPHREYATIDSADSEKSVTAAIQRVLGRRVTAFSENDTSIFIRTRGHSGAWGSIVFHGGLLIILIGLYLSHIGSVRESLSLTEGEWCTLSTSETNETKTAALISSKKSTTAMRLQLQRFEYDCVASGTTTSASHLVTEYEGVRNTAIAQVNQSMSAGDWNIHHTGTWGYAPELVVLGLGDSILFHGSIRVSATAMARGAYHDSVRIDNGPRAMQLRLYPDFVRTGTGDSSRSKLPRNPVLFITQYNDDGTSMEVPLALGQNAQAGGLRFVFPRLHRWSQLDAVRDPGLGFLLYGCIISVLGLFLRISCTEKTIGARLTAHGEGSQITLVGRTEKYPCSFRDEMKQLENRISAELGDDQE